jgi:hypothetical protein
VAMSYMEAVRGMASFSIEISATSGPKTEMREMDLLPMSLCRVEEDLSGGGLFRTGGEDNEVDGEEIDELELWRRKEQRDELGEP